MKILICPNCKKLYILDDSKTLSECNNPSCGIKFDGEDVAVEVKILNQLVE